MINQALILSIFVTPFKTNKINQNYW